MEALDKSILLIGESGVGKSHYGAQLLKRLMQENGRIRMHGAATNLEPFETVMAKSGCGTIRRPYGDFGLSRKPLADRR